MILPNNKFLLDVDRSLEGVLKDAAGNPIIINEQKLFVSRHFEPYRHVTQRGHLFAVCKNVFTLDNCNRRNFYDAKLKEGDCVYFHHFALHPESEITYKDKKYYLQEYDELYAVEKEGTVVMLEEYVFIEPVFESEEDIMKSGIFIKPTADLKVFHGVLRFINDRTSKKYNIKSGDKILFQSGAEYKMLIKGEVLYRTKAHMILAKY